MLRDRGWRGGDSERALGRVVGGVPARALSPERPGT